MKRIKEFFFFAVCLVMLMAPMSVQAAEPDVVDPGWPRVFTKGGDQLTVYQPQIDHWTDYKDMGGRFAIALKLGSAKEEKYGVVEVAATTVVDHEARVVAIMPSKREIRFPNVSDKEETALRTKVDEIMPPQSALTVSLDRVLAYLDPDEQKDRRVVDVNLDPPKIFYSRTPAVLVIFMGEPEFKPVVADKPELMYAVNTNWDVFFDPAAQKYYLLNGESWLTAPDVIKGPWTPTTDLPAALLSLPADDNWNDVRDQLPGKLASESPIIFAVTEPAELIVTKGEPSFNPVPGTQLMVVANTDTTLFLHSGEGQYYFLVAGRWFRAKTMEGPWSAASQDLPGDFVNIPEDAPAAFVKASVPGTREAKDAVLLASVPKTTTVTVAPVVEKVVYAGDPKFVTIEGTSVMYAVNTPATVFLVNGTYYWCSNGIWLTGLTSIGPWSYATVVPAPIYTIPPVHPAYHVTYVKVYSSSPTVVTYSYTSGYSGEYVAANGVLMFGMGVLIGVAIADHHDDYYYYHGPAFSYGCGAVYHHGYGGYYRSAHVYGPYGGAGRGAAYNPSTGTYARGAYRYGPNGSVSAGRAYNPYTGGYAQGVRVDTAYGSAGRGYVEQGGKAAIGGYRSGPEGSAAGIRTSEGSGMAAWDTQNGQGMVGKDQEGNLYAGKDGNVYKKDSDGNWSSNSGSGWESVDKPQPTGSVSATSTSSRSETAKQTGARPTTASTGSTATRGTTQASTRPSTSNTSTQSLNQQAQARDWGNQQSQRAASTSASTSSSSSRGARSSFSSGRSGGGRRGR